MVVEGLLHFRFEYRFCGTLDTHFADIYAKDAEKAKRHFSTSMLNAPKVEVLNVEIVEGC